MTTPPPPPAEPDDLDELILDFAKDCLIARRAKERALERIRRMERWRKRESPN